ncbi:unnamed protein product [Adineta steineri]|uniref:Thiaminase-2/PQQC domain-containing protein n=1 Tax=Adineta steineri TaxID=433720 RepID=A0A814RGY0_9BILA|nr:unnamed protein product [Adineta steineri]
MSFSASLSHDKLFRASSEHEFIQLVSNGQIKQQQFDRWLTQDYLFVTLLCRFVAHVLVNAPRQDYKILISGLSTLEEELTWFENKLKEKNINIEDIKPLPANLNYQNWINELISSKKSYLSLITTYYAIEICYYQAWKSVKNRDYQEYADRWGSKEFEQYIDQLRVSVDNASITASDDDKNDASHLWNTIMEFEIDFWNMAINETS